ncbi:MAG: hypothetical protein GYA51_13465 [Candidatus Methanofastidiosa archaeon]|nr:hypothetical protein [Candidatus Methanofastidiosa archaeon]
MKKDCLGKAILILKELRESQKSNLEKSVLQKIDNAISMLEECEVKERYVDVTEILNIFGFVLQSLPQIIEIAEKIIGK